MNEQEAKLRDRGGACLLAGPGRGDCLHFIGIPTTSTTEDYDEYGKPAGWCWLCWKGELRDRALRDLDEYKKKLWKEQDRNNEIRHLRDEICESLRGYGHEMETFPDSIKRLRAELAEEKAKHCPECHKSIIDEMETNEKLQETLSAAHFVMARVWLDGSIELRKEIDKSQAWADLRALTKPKEETTP